MTVLVVEDDAALLTVISKVLTHFKKPFMQATGYEQARALLSECAKISVLVTDNKLAGRQTGIELIREAQSTRDGLRCVIMTGNVHGLDFEGIQSCPEILKKPFSIEDFMEAVFPELL